MFRYFVLFVYVVHFDLSFKKHRRNYLIILNQ